jgi:hypothetical protein
MIRWRGRSIVPQCWRMRFVDKSKMWPNHIKAEEITPLHEPIIERTHEWTFHMGLVLNPNPPLANSVHHVDAHILRSPLAEDYRDG